MGALAQVSARSEAAVAQELMVLHKHTLQELILDVHYQDIASKKAEEKANNLHAPRHFGNHRPANESHCLALASASRVRVRVCVLVPHRLRALRLRPGRLCRSMCYRLL